MILASPRGLLPGLLMLPPWRAPHAGLYAVPSTAHGACLGCQWIDQPGTSMEEPGWRDASATVARRHDSSHGEFRDQPDQ